MAKGPHHRFAVLLHGVERSSPHFFFLTLLLLFLLLSNAAAIFYLRTPLLARIDLLGKIPPAETVPISGFSSSSSIMLAVQEDAPIPKQKKHGETESEQSPGSPLAKKVARREGNLSWIGGDDEGARESSGLKPVGRRSGRSLKLLQRTSKSQMFSSRVDAFLKRSCWRVFFLTWISSEELFGKRELLTVESLFKSNPDACLLIVSHSMDSRRGNSQLRPFRSRGFRVAAMSPNYTFILKDTPAEAWFQRLKQGAINPGEVPLGQNLSNLLRLALLYKFGGIYVDTDVIVLRSFSGLRNVVGAQAVDAGTGNWSRLNNAVMIFDKGHPLLFKFMEEFTVTFNGNRWGFNGPYLVSRVVSREPAANLTVLRPAAFYPVDWSRILSLFHGPRSEAHTQWAAAKLEQIRRESFAVHLWNRQTRMLKVEAGSVIARLMLDNCIFCKPLQPAS